MLFTGTHADTQKATGHLLTDRKDTEGPAANGAFNLQGDGHCVARFVRHFHSLCVLSDSFTRFIQLGCLLILLKIVQVFKFFK